LVVGFWSTPQNSRVLVAWRHPDLDLDLDLDLEKVSQRVTILICWKIRVVYWGLGFLFILKFGKFPILEAWDVIGPLFR
jgi:hypothetical protein